MRTAHSQGARRGPRIAAVGLLLVIGLMGVLWSALVRGQTAGRGGLAINATGRAGQVRVRPAPEFELRLFEGGTFRLADQRGKLVVVNFWASWCPPCREEAPALEQVWQEYRARGVVVVGANVWEERQPAVEFVKEFDLTYPNGVDPSGSLAVEYGVTGLPETFFIDEEGRLVRRWIGPIDEAQLRQVLDDLLAS